MGWTRNENKHGPALFDYTDTALGVFYCFRYLLFVYLLLRMLSFLIYVCVSPPPPSFLMDYSCIHVGFTLVDN